jgi:hypothetical protein
MDFEIITDLCFHISIFMPKIFANNLDKYNKSCSAPHQESSKIEFAVF